MAAYNANGNGMEAHEKSQTMAQHYPISPNHTGATPPLPQYEQTPPAISPSQQPGTYVQQPSMAYQQNPGQPQMYHQGSYGMPPPQQQYQGQPMQPMQSMGGQPGGGTQFQTAVAIPNLGMGSAPVDCPSCGKRGMTRLEYEAGNTTHAWALGICCLTGCLCFIPYLMNSLKDVKHHCGNCGVLLATWHKSGNTQAHMHA